MQNTPAKLARSFAVVLAFVLVAAGCGDDDDGGSAGGLTAETSEACFADAGLDAISLDGVDTEALAGTTLQMVAYDSFVVSEGVFEQFEAETGITVEILTAADTGAMVSQAVLNAGNPVADVMWGIDNTSLCRGLEADIFTPYESAVLGDIIDDLQVDDQHRITPVNFGDTCVNWVIDELETAPTSLDDLAEPEFASQFVTQNPQTSAPGMGLLLSTIAAYGDDWEDYWQRMADNGVSITSGWSEAYFEQYAVSGGDKALVQSYATSPVADVIFAENPPDEAPTAVLFDSCFRSIEFAGVLAGTDHPEAAALLVDFLAGPVMQADLPFNNFVYPANETVEIPAEFDAFGPLADDPLMLAPEVIAANRDAWTERWVEIVLR